MVASMQHEVGWHEGSAAPAYCTIMLAVSQVLHAASQAAPPAILSSPEFTSSATETLLLSLKLTASLRGLQDHGQATDFHRGGDVQYEQGLPPGCNSEGMRQLQTGLGLVCEAGRQLLHGCSGPLQLQLATSLVLAVLPIIPALPAGISCHLPCFAAVLLL